MKFSAVIILVTSILAGCASTDQLQPKKVDAFAQYETALLQGKADYLAGDYGKARPFFAEQAKSGNPVAQYVYGYMLFYGQGGEIDAVGAEKWIRKAAEMGHSKALRALALLTSQRAKNQASEGN